MSKYSLIMNRKKRSPISRNNLLNYYEGLLNMYQNGIDQESREYAFKKLQEYDPVFRKYLPSELFQIPLIDKDI